MFCYMSGSCVVFNVVLSIVFILLCAYFNTDAACINKLYYGCIKNLNVKKIFVCNFATQKSLQAA